MVNHIRIIKIYSYYFMGIDRDRRLRFQSSQQRSVQGKTSDTMHGELPNFIA